MTDSPKPGTSSKSWLDTEAITDEQSQANLNVPGLGHLKPAPDNQTIDIAQRTLDPFTPLSTIVPLAFQAPTETEVETWAPIKTVTDDVLSPSDLDEIDGDLATYIKEPTARRLIYYLLARACYDNGSSPYTVYPGKYDIGGKVITLEQVAAVIRRVTSMRRFARFWAKTIYSIAKAKNEPPIKWAKHGFSYQTRFAAFDFFDAVVASNTPPAIGVPTLTPTNEEIAANATARAVQTYRSNNSYLRSLQPEVSGGGLCGPKPVSYGAGCSR